MRTRSNKSYDITKTHTQKRGTKSTSQYQRRIGKNLQEDPDYQPFRQLRSARSRTRGTSSSTTFKPIIIKVKKAFKKPAAQCDPTRFLSCKTLKFKRPARRPRWNYGKLVAAQAEAHRAAFQEAGVTQAPPPTWSYVRALAEKAAIRAVHRAAFQEAGRDRALLPTWSYRRIAAARKELSTAHRAAFEDSGVDRIPLPTWSYKRAAAGKARRSALQAERVAEVPPLTWRSQRYESLSESSSTRESSTQTESSSILWSGSPNWSALPAATVEYIPTVLPFQRYESLSESSSTCESSSETSESSDFDSWPSLPSVLPYVPTIFPFQRYESLRENREPGYEPSESSDYSSL